MSGTAEGIGSDESTTARSARVAYQPALDGVRALAVTVVLLFHAEVAGFGGGYLGVSVFFTLSGFLITSLLVAETTSTGHVRFGAFYARRARRLLPASLLLVSLVVLAAWVTDWFAGVADLRAHVVGSVLQVANWVFLAGGGSYQELLQQASGAASPLEHYWSLAIEEQFYWLWPIAFAGLWRLGRTTRGRLLLLGVVTAILVAAAPVTAAVWGSDAAYWASPARAAEILLGAFLALAITGRTVPKNVWVLAPLALVVLGICVVAFPAVGGPAYSGWLPAVGLTSAALLLGLQVDSPLRSALSASPLVWLGRISYGVYLFHWPIFVVMNPDRMGFGGVGLLALRVGLTLVLAQLSFVLFERPIRKLSTAGVRPTFVLAGTATAATIIAAVVVVPGAASEYWTTPDEVAVAAALDTDDAPLLVVAGPASTSASTASQMTMDTIAPGDGADPRTRPPADAADSPGTTSVPASSTPSAEGSPPNPSTTAEAPLPALSRPVRIIVAGDSTAAAFGAGVVSWAAASPAVAQAELFGAPGCGFLRGGEYRAGDTWTMVADACSTWVERSLPERVAATGADVVVLITTVWDVLDHRWDAGAGLTPDSPEMRARLVFDFTRVTQELLAGGAKSVVWVKAPIPDPFWLPRADVQEEPARHKALHEVMDLVAADHPGQVHIIDLLGYFDDNDLTLDRETRPDGIHVDPEMAERIATDHFGDQLVRAALGLL